MITYQDYLSAGEVGAFLLRAVEAHKASELYTTAVIAREYDQRRNPTIGGYQQIGDAVYRNIIADFMSE